MATIPLPALHAAPPPQQESPFDAYARIVNLKSTLLAQQGQEMQNQQMQLASQDDAKWRQIMSNPDWNGSPDQLLKMARQAQVGPKSYLTIQQGLLAAAKAHADLDEVSLKNEQTRNDQYRGRLLSIVQATDGQKQDLWDQELTREEQAGQIKPGALSHTYPGDDAVQTLANHFALGSTLAKEAIDNKNAEARASQADTTAQRLTLETPGIQARNELSAKENASFGQPTERDKYIQLQENNRAALARQATNANDIQRAGLTELQKQGDDYSNVLRTGNTLKASLAAAKTGNEMAAAVAPLQGTLFVTTAEGVKRINETELSGVSGAGSLVQRINGALGRQTGKGPLSDELKDDMAQLVDLYTAAKHDAYLKNVAYTQKLRGMDPNSTPVMDKDGSITTLPKVVVGSLPQGNGRVIDKATAQQFYQAAGGDPRKAQQLAEQNGWKVQ